MSTRCVVTVIDGTDSFSVYRHCDGYPGTEHGVIAALEAALPLAWPLPRFEAADFAAAIVAAWKTGGGGNVYMTKGRQAHGDLEYAYEVRQHPSSGGHVSVRVLEPAASNGRWKTVETCVVPPVGPLGALALDATTVGE